MKVVFVQRDCLLRASGYNPERVSGDIRLSEDAVAALRDLAATALFTILIGRDTLSGSEEAGERLEKGVMRALAEMVSAA